MTLVDQDSYADQIRERTVQVDAAYSNERQMYRAYPAKPGAKDDSGKLRMDLIPAISLSLLPWRLPVETIPEQSEACRLLMRWRAEGKIEDLCAAASYAGLSLGAGTWLEEVARVLEYGAYKAPRPDGSFGYGENNWQGVPEGITRYYAAALRHWARARAGERCDSVSKLPHMAHFLTCVLFLIYLEVQQGRALGDRVMAALQQTRKDAAE